MDIKEKITEVFEKITKDEDLKTQFKEDPTKAVESVIGVDLPDDMINNVVTGVKAKLAGDGIKGGLDSLKNLF